MDREVPHHVKKKERNKIIVRIAIITLAIIAGIFFMNKFLEDSISLKEVSIGTVDEGVLEVTMSASGKIFPLVEEVIVSPINTRILEIYKNIGDTVLIGEPILRLELASVETDYNQKVDEFEMKKSKLLQSQISLQNQISELKMQAEVKSMQLKRMQTELKNEQYLDSIGASTTDKIRQASINYEVAKLELQQLKQQIENQQKNADAEEKVQALDLSIFQKSLTESARLLQDARILSPQKATLTYLNNQIGSQVAAGTQIAIVSDLSHFKVMAEIPDGHAERLSLGAKAVVKIGLLELTGSVANITPSIENGVINFTVILEDAGNSKLRSGLKTDVHVRHGIREGVFRIPNQSYYVGAGIYDLWIVKGEQVEKRQVKLGESSFEYVEVISGLAIGEKIIISDMSRYKNSTTIKLKQ